MDTGIRSILELSADAQIRRRQVVRNSREFHHLTGAIGAFGKVLELLAGVQEAEELCAGAESIPRRAAAAGVR